MQIDRPIAIAVIFFVVLLMLVYLVVPEYKVFKQLRMDLGEKIAEYDAEYAYYSEIDKVYEDIQSHKDEIAKIDDALPKDAEVGRIIYFLYKTATKSGVVLKDLSLTKSNVLNAQTGEERKLKTIAFSADLVGNYASLGKFMLNLEKSSRIFEVTSISFGSIVESQAEQATSSATTSRIKAATRAQLQNGQTYNFSLQLETHSY